MRTPEQMTREVQGANLSFRSRTRVALIGKDKSLFKVNLYDIDGKKRRLHVATAETAVQSTAEDIGKAWVGAQPVQPLEEALAEEESAGLPGWQYSAGFGFTMINRALDRGAFGQRHTTTIHGETVNEWRVRLVSDYGYDAPSDMLAFRTTQGEACASYEDCWNSALAWTGGPLDQLAKKD